MLMLAPSIAAAEPAKKCVRVIASKTSVRELKVIGVIDDGQRRSILVTDGKKPVLVKPGDCVGRERVRWQIEQRGNDGVPSPHLSGGPRPEVRGPTV